MYLITTSSLLRDLSKWLVRVVAARMDVSILGGPRYCVRQTYLAMHCTDVVLSVMTRKHASSQEDCVTFRFLDKVGTGKEPDPPPWYLVQEEADCVF